MGERMLDPALTIAECSDFSGNQASRRRAVAATEVPGSTPPTRLHDGDLERLPLADPPVLRAVSTLRLAARHPGSALSGSSTPTRRVLGCPRQRCTVQFTRDVIMPSRRDQSGPVAAALRESFQAENGQAAKERVTSVPERLAPVARVAPKVCDLRDAAEDELAKLLLVPARALDQDPLDERASDIGAFLIESQEAVENVVGDPFDERISADQAVDPLAGAAVEHNTVSALVLHHHPVAP